jgi:long-chain acyl-CoA synthetase
MYSGGSIGFYRGDTRTLKDDLALLKPTTFASVPRVYNKFYDLIKSKFDAATGVSAWLIKKGLATKIENAKKGIFTHALWDRLVFNKVRDALGGNVRYAVVGGAPISGEVLTFLRAVLCCPIQEGYG